MFQKREVRLPRGISAEEQLREALDMADAVVIGAGAGLSTSAGFLYSGDRFSGYFGDFEKKYGFHDMYTGGFYPYKTLEEYWAYWSRYIQINRYMQAPKPVYEKLRHLLEGKDYFVITTNVDHCFQKAGFDRQRLFYTQGDYGLFQCSRPCHKETYDNEEMIRKMVEAQGYQILPSGEPRLPEGTLAKTAVPPEMVPYCPKCGRPMTMNLRSDGSFVEDKGWREAAGRYEAFLRRIHGRKVLFLEMGVGYNTPVIIKYPFWKMTARNPQAVYACLNAGDSGCPEKIQNRSICIDSDIGETLERLRSLESLRGGVSA